MSKQKRIEQRAAEICDHIISILGREITTYDPDDDDDDDDEGELTYLVGKKIYEACTAQESTLNEVCHKSNLTNEDKDRIKEAILRAIEKQENYPLLILAEQACEAIEFINAYN